MNKLDGAISPSVTNIRNQREDSHVDSSALRRNLEALEAANRRIKQLEKAQERQRVVLQKIRVNASRSDDAFTKTFTKTTADIQYIQQQLEYVVMSLERERGIVADHTEQLRLFARETNRRDGRGAAVSEEGPSVLFWLATWLYRPLVHFAKGCYTLLSPFINTIHSLSLFNSDVVIRRNEIGTRFRDTETSEGLLKRLQRGLLDPPSIAKKSC